MSNGVRVVDCHCHVGVGVRKQQTAEQLLRAMDEHGVDLAVICPVDEHIAVSNAAGNQEMIQAVRAHPDRFVGLAVANPWYGEKAKEGLTRALGEGLKGLKINATLQGHWVNDLRLDPLLELVRERGGHVYVHSGTPDYSMPFEICDLAARHPGVNFIMGHSGWTDIFWRQAFSSAIRPGLPNVYYDPSHVCFISEIGDAIQRVGAQRFVFGSDSPAGSLKQELWKIRGLAVGEPALTRIFSENMLSILKL
jgi:hypothetical protein